MVKNTIALHKSDIKNDLDHYALACQVENYPNHIINFNNGNIL